MKKLLKATILLLILTFILPVVPVSSEPNATEQKDMRGVWVSTVVNIDYPSKATDDPETLKKEALKILDDSKAMGLNAVFLQVRPASDAVYKSDIFPWSKYITGQQGIAPKNGFDPLEFWVTEAHNRGMELHAWLNPYRVTKNKSTDPKHDFASLDPSNPAVLHPDWVVKYYDGNLYYNPGIPEVRKLVVDGAVEIIQKYDVDGIHLDDYFYPGKNFQDSETYKKYGAGFASLDDWRRENVNLLIGDLNKAIKATSKDVSFGVSPFAIWANKSTNKLGSDTKGKQAYYEQYADTRKWTKEGMLDYIAPQIYWNIGYSIADYNKILAWWADVVSGTGVDLYVGQAAYKVGSTKTTDPWYGVEEIARQLRLNAKTPEVKGSIFFSYKSFINNPALGTVVKAVYEQRDGVAAPVPVGVSKPGSNISTGLSQYYLNGASDPSKPLYLNGKEVLNRSEKGYFGILVPLSKGQNVFTLSQEGSYVTRVINRTVASTAAATMKTADILAASTFPQAQEFRSEGEKITLACQAPAGAKVTVKIGSETYPMKQAVATPKGTAIYPVKFTYVYTIPTFLGTPQNIDFGAPEYTMVYKGITKTRVAPGKVVAIMKNSPFYAEVAKPVINTYNTATTANGAAYELYQGMLNPITTISGSYARLSTGQWVNKNDIKISMAEAPFTAAITKAEYVVGEKWDTVSLQLSAPSAAFAAFDGKALKLTIANAHSSVQPLLPENGLISALKLEQLEDRVVYTLTLKENVQIEGHYIEKTTDGITLNIKRPVRAKLGEKPLEGITIMLDPGHGGSDTGAIGPLGAKYAEKSINLNAGLKLQKELETLGAAVLMTRNTDKALSLDARLSSSRAARPDLFISLHANSAADNSDLSKIYGFSVYYRDKQAIPISDVMQKHVIDTLGRVNRNVRTNNFYVIRSTWTPSILLETGFVPNPTEFEWLSDDNQQGLLAKSLAESIVKYFTR